jgi:hypothetical protein
VLHSSSEALRCQKLSTTPLKAGSRTGARKHNSPEQFCLVQAEHGFVIS